MRTAQSSKGQFRELALSHDSGSNRRSIRSLQASGSTARRRFIACNHSPIPCSTRFKIAKCQPGNSFFEEYVAAKSHRTKKYLAEIKKSRASLEGLLNRLVCDIAPAELEPNLSRRSGAYRNAVMRYLRAMFNHGIKRGYLLDNPILKLDFAHRVRREVQTIPYSIVAKMLNHAIDNDLQVLPFLVLGFFAGIRPDGELQKLEWSDVLFEEKTIVIRPEVSKTNRRRFPKFSANAQSWLDAYKTRGGVMEGKIVPFTPITLRRKKRANWSAATDSDAKWIQQGMRHTFCSNWLALHKDVNELVLQSGHNSVDTIVAQLP